MKRLLLFFALLLSTTAGLHAQWDTLRPQAPTRNIFKISPFHFVEGTFLLGYERMLGSGQSSLMFLAGVHSRERFDFPEPSFGTLEEFQFRYYVSPPKNTGVNGGNFMFFKGFYAGPYLYHRFRQQSRQVFDWILQSNQVVNENINEFSGGVLLGVQVALGNRFFMDLYTGGGIKRSFGRDPNVNQFGYADVTQPGYNGVIPKIGFMIGVGL